MSWNKNVGNRVSISRGGKKTKGEKGNTFFLNNKKYKEGCKRNLLIPLQVKSIDAIVADIDKINLLITIVQDINNSSENQIKQNSHLTETTST